MTHSIKIADAAFTKTIGTAIPYVDLAEMILLLGGDETLSTKNYAGTKTPALKIGTPVYAQNYVTLSQTDGFESADAAIGGNFTFIGVVAHHSGVGAYFGRWISGSTTASLVYRSVNTLSVAVNNSKRVELGTSGNDFKFVAGSYDGSAAKVYVGNAGSLGMMSGAYAVPAGSQKFRVGASLFNSSTFKAAAVGVFNSALSDAQVTDLYLAFKKSLLSRGIVVS